MQDRNSPEVQGVAIVLQPPAPVGFFGVYRGGTLVGCGGATFFLPTSNEANLWVATVVFPKNGFANRICNMFANGFANHTRPTRIRYRQRKKRTRSTPTRRYHRSCFLPCATHTRRRLPYACMDSGKNTVNAKKRTRPTPNAPIPPKLFFTLRDPYTTPASVRLYGFRKKYRQREVVLNAAVWRQSSKVLAANQTNRTNLQIKPIKPIEPIEPISKSNQSNQSATVHTQRHKQ